jgi:crossover junction endodeoxyribonuclease RuvC
VDQGASVTHILGIDPGLSGGYALLDDTANLLACGTFPTHTVNKKQRLDGATMGAMFKPLTQTVAYIEAVASRPRQQGQFQFGVNTGIVHGILYAHDIQFTLVSPASWKAQYGIKRGEDETKRDKKNEARQIAQSLYPAHADKFSRVKDDGVAEAVLIALYGLYLHSTT